MSPDSTKPNTRQSLARSALAAPWLTLFLVVLLSVSACSILPEPGSPSTLNSPVQTLIPTAMQVTVTLQPTRALKPSPTGIEFATPEPVDLAPIPGSTPAGAGALVRIQPPFSSMQYHIENTWYRNLDAQTRIFVYAGSLAGPLGEQTQQGVVIVRIIRNNHGTPELLQLSTYRTSTQTGAVHITGAVGERLIAQSTNGTTFYFDIPARQFVPSLTWVSPIATPSPRPVTPSP